MKNRRKRKPTTCWWCTAPVVGERRWVEIAAGEAHLRHMSGFVADFSDDKGDAHLTCPGCEPFLCVDDAEGLARRVVRCWIDNGKPEAVTVAIPDLVACFRQLIARAV